MGQRLFQPSLNFDQQGSLGVIWEIPSEHQAEAFQTRGHDAITKFVFDRLESVSLNPALDHSGEYPPSVRDQIERQFKEKQAAYVQGLMATRHEITVDLDEITRRACDAGGQHTSDEYERYEQFTERLHQNIADCYRAAQPLEWESYPYGALTILEMSYCVFNTTGSFELVRPDIYLAYQLPKISLALYGPDGSWQPRAVINGRGETHFAIFEVKDGVKIDSDIKQLRYFKHYLPGAEVNLILTERAWVNRKYFRPHATRILLWDYEIGLLEETF